MPFMMHYVNALLAVSKAQYHDVYQELDRT